MRAHEIMMESDLSERNTARLNRATTSFQNGFETETARKEAMADLSRIYEDGLREEIQKKLRPLYWATLDKDTSDVIPGQEARNEQIRELMDIVPFNLSQIREKHFAVFGEYGDLPMLKRLLTLRQEMKDAPLVPTKRELEKQAKAAALAANTIIADATRPLKEAAIERTRQSAEEFVAESKATLTAHGFDPYSIVPKVPDLNYSYSNRPSHAELVAHREKKARADAERQPFLQFIDRTNGSDFHWSQKGADHYVEICVRSTSDHYDSYVAKMNDKIKNPTSAQFRWVGDVWGHSVLVVTLQDGTQETWKTQVIINRSKLGLLFNQWPTRRVK